MRNKLSLDFFAELGTLSPKANFVTLQINGRHEGCILSWSQWMNIFWRNGIWRKGLFYAVDDDANFSLVSDLERDTKTSLELGYEKKTGTKEDDLYLQDMIYKINTVPKSEFKGRSSNTWTPISICGGLRASCLPQTTMGLFIITLCTGIMKRTFEVIPWDYDATWEETFTVIGWTPIMSEYKGLIP